MISLLTTNTLNLDARISNLITFSIFSLIIVFIIEPERIKPLTIFATILLVVIVLSMFTDNIRRLVVNEEKKYYTYWQLENVGLFLGVANYAFESIGSLINSNITHYF